MNYIKTLKDHIDTINQGIKDKKYPESDIDYHKGVIVGIKYAIDIYQNKSPTVTDLNLLEGIVSALDEIRVTMIQTEREITELKRRQQ